MLPFLCLSLGLSVILFTLGLSKSVSLAAAIMAGAAGLFTGSAAQTALLRHQSDKSIGMASVASVAALWAIAWAGTKPFASLLDGWLASHIGIVLTTIILTSPALAIALCEIWLPESAKQFIKDKAMNATTNLRNKLYVCPEGTQAGLGLDRMPEPSNGTTVTDEAVA